MNDARRELLNSAASEALFAGLSRARRSFNTFSDMVLLDEEGNSTKQSDIHRVWQVHIEACWAAGKHPAILAPWAHAKTTQLVVGKTAHELGKNTNLRVKIVCNTDPKARERLMGISAMVTRNARYRLVFPWVKPSERPTEDKAIKAPKGKWTQHELYLQRRSQAIDPSLQAAGVLSTGIGGRADYLVFDDICDQRNSIDNPELRSKVIKNMDNVWMSRLEPHGRVLYVGTPWHQADATAEITNRPAWCVLRQWISDDFKRIEQEVYNPPPGYPLPMIGRSNWLPQGYSNGGRVPSLEL